MSEIEDHSCGQRVAARSPRGLAGGEGAANLRLSCPTGFSRCSTSFFPYGIVHEYHVLRGSQNAYFCFEYAERYTLVGIQRKQHEGIVILRLLRTLDGQHEYMSELSGFRQ